MKIFKFMVHSLEGPHALSLSTVDKACGAHAPRGREGVFMGLKQVFSFVSFSGQESALRAKMDNEDGTLFI